MTNTARKLSELNKCLCGELTEYFKHLDGHAVMGLYEMVIQEVEKSLLEVVMQQAKNNQSNAAIILGMSRGTLRKKLKLYNLSF
jgi:Fis family transcriptional regulator